MLPADPFAADAPLPRLVPVRRAKPAPPGRPRCGKCAGAGTHREGFCLDCDGRGHSPDPLPF